MRILGREVTFNRLYALIGILCIGGAIFAYKIFIYKDPVVPVGYTAALPARGMADVPTHDVVIKTPIKALDKKQAAKRMKLPPAVTDDPEQEVISTASMEPSEGGYTSATVINTSTGESTTIVREETPPWFQFGGKTEIGAGIDLSTKYGQVGVIEARQDVLRLWGINLVVNGAIKMAPTGAEALAGARVIYRW